MFADWRAQLRPALVLLGLLTALSGLLYPLLITGIAGVVFPSQAEGSLVLRQGVPVGSRLIGQEFLNPAYFWARPSATTPPYNAGASGGSNLGPANPSLAAAFRNRADGLRSAGPNHRAPIPADLLTASGSGLDPHLSPAAAFYQVPRVARARRIPDAGLRALVSQLTEDRQFGLLGEPRVNVLELNLALDRIAGCEKPAPFTAPGGGTIGSGAAGATR